MATEKLSHVGKTRLKKLADYVSRHKLPNFSMHCFSRCLMSLMPIIWPKYWDANTSYPCLKNFDKLSYYPSYQDMAEEFFRLPKGGGAVLFSSMENRNAPKKDMVIKIRNYIKEHSKV